MSSGPQPTQNLHFLTFSIIDGKVTLTEIADGIDLDKDILDQMPFKPFVAEPLKQLTWD